MLLGFACVLAALLATSVLAEEKEAPKATTATTNNLVTATVNGNNANDYLKLFNDNTKWTLRYKKDFHEDPSKWIATDTSQCDMKWSNATAPYQYGLYGCNQTVTFPFEVSRPIQKVRVIASVANYADSKNRTVYVEYSLDNKEFTTLAKTEFGVVAKKLEGDVDFSGKNVKKIWIRLRGTDNDINPYVVFHDMDIALVGDIGS